ncbi:MAG TPA: dienelactone hydrolase family protein [Baekduia sp.]|nr:dienelactone hydrolase family protein [Baekduia sp.]
MTDQRGEDMGGEMIDVKTPDGVADAYLADPGRNEKGRPTVLLLMDVFGLRPQIKRMADRVASRGFVVLAPNVFYRAGRAPLVPIDGLDDPARRDSLFEKIRPMMHDLTPERMASDGGAYLDRLQQGGWPAVAVIGYCMGGRMGWEIATAFPDRVAALGAFHTGGLVTDDVTSPHRKAERIAAELYFGHADNDHSMTAEHIATLEHALDDAGVRYRSEVYEGAPHGYTMADSAAYHEVATERHFAEVFALLERTIAHEP